MKERKLSISGGPGNYQVRLDNIDIAYGIRGLTLRLGQGADLPTATLDLAVWSIGDAELAAVPRIPDATRELLIGLGWTPPTALTRGAFVRYRLTEQDADAINQRRADGVRARTSTPVRSGVVIHDGNTVLAGDIFPALVVRIFNPDGEPAPPVNLQVFLDGNDTYWAASKSEGDQPGTWHRPEGV